MIENPTRVFENFIFTGRMMISLYQTRITNWYGQIVELIAAGFEDEQSQALNTTAMQGTLSSLIIGMACIRSSSRENKVCHVALSYANGKVLPLREMI